MRQEWTASNGERVMLVSGLNGYHQMVVFDKTGWCRLWWDSKGNKEEFLISYVGVKKNGSPDYQVDYISSTVLGI